MNEELSQEEVPDNQDLSRDSSGKWRPGFSGNLKGRTPGKTMKEYAKEYLSKLTEEEKDKWLAGLPKDIVWRMAEGQPRQETEVDATISGPGILRLDE